MTQLEHWTCALAIARNTVVHSLESTQHEYHEPDSPYNGPFVEIGDRVVREIIAVLLGVLGYPSVWRRGLSRASLDVYRRLTTKEDPEGG